jgi:nucleoside-diphosphate-sugar epimerase
VFDHVKPVIALTGATGFLGSHLMNALLLKGYDIIALGRPTKGESLDHRISKLLKWFGNGNYTGKLEILEIDYLKPMLGLPSEKYSLLCSKTDQIIHCASDTSFSERRREQVFEFNVQILSGLLEFASCSHSRFFHYISTAYVAGINGPICKEKLSAATEFTNVYEESKSKAEQIINDYCQKNSIPLTLIRPTIVYGDSQTGRSLRFNALYHPIRSVLNIRDIYLNDLLNHGGKRSHSQGIHLDHKGYLHLPIRIYLPKRGGINLIPVDYFVSAAQKIIANPSPGGIYHLTNHNSPTLEDIVAYNENFMKVKGIEVLYGKPEEFHPRNPAEELFDRFIAPYQPYLSDERIFESTNTDLATGNLYPSEFTSRIFRICMEYALKVDWGESIFTQEEENQPICQNI